MMPAVYSVPVVRENTECVRQENWARGKGQKD